MNSSTHQYNPDAFNSGRADAKVEGIHRLSVLSFYDIIPSLDWRLLELPLHAGVHKWVADLNRLCRDSAPLYQVDFDPAGFEWFDCSDDDASVVSLIRKGAPADPGILIICNLTPVVRRNYRIGAPRSGIWQELLNSDAKEYGGSGVGNMGEVEAAPLSCHGRRHSRFLTLPPLSILFLGNVDAAAEREHRPELGRRDR